MMRLLIIFLTCCSAGLAAKTELQYMRPQLVATECNKNRSICFHIKQQKFYRNGTLGIWRRLELDDGGGFHHTEVELGVPKDIPHRLHAHRMSVDKLTITHSSYKVMISVGFVTEALSLENQSQKMQNVLMIGLGGAVISNFFAAPKFSHLMINLTVVELDPFVVAIAKKWFGHAENERNHVIIDDGIDYVQRAKAEGRKFKVLILDACYNEQENSLFCPVEGFLEDETIRNMAHILEDEGTLVVNVVLWQENQQQWNNILRKFQRIFPSCSVNRLGGSRILICSKKPNFTLKDQKMRFLANLKKADATLGFNMAKSLRNV